MEFLFFLLLVGVMFFVCFAVKKPSSSAASLSVKRNNPGNIRSVSTKWIGEIGAENGFCVFDSLENGIRAASRVLNSYWRSGYKTVRSIIYRWAPPSENKTEAYIRFVCERSGLKPDEEVNTVDKRSKLLEAMFVMEGNPVAYSVIEPVVMKNFDLR